MFASWDGRDNVTSCVLKKTSNFETGHSGLEIAVVNVNSCTCKSRMMVTKAGRKLTPKASRWVRRERAKTFGVLNPF